MEMKGHLNNPVKLNWLKTKQRFGVLQAIHWIKWTQAI